MWETRVSFLREKCENVIFNSRYYFLSNQLVFHHIICLDFMTTRSFTTVRSSDEFDGLKFLIQKKQLCSLCTSSTPAARSNRMHHSAKTASTPLRLQKGKQTLLEALVPVDFRFDGTCRDGLRDKTSNDKSSIDRKRTKMSNEDKKHRRSTAASR